jgi:hypothetical protein
VPRGPCATASATDPPNAWRMKPKLAKGATPSVQSVELMLPYLASGQAPSSITLARAKFSVVSTLSVSPQPMPRRANNKLIGNACAPG